MPTIEAGQHLYGNVEADRSPRGRGGFQTLLHTPQLLTESEASELEGRLPYFPGETAPVKRLFFRLTTGKLVVAQVVPLTGTDSAGRKGRYLAHSLVFTSDQLAQLDHNPFGLFASFAFATTIDAALAAGDCTTGTAPPASLTVSTDTATGFDQVRLTEELVLLALRCRELAQARTPVAFVGTPEEVEHCLASLWPVLPRALRADCSFDTWFYRGNLVATYYWAIGLPDPPPNPQIPLVRAADGTVERTSLEGPVGSFDRWVTAGLSRGDQARVANERETAYAVACLLEGDEVDAGDLSNVSAATAEAVFAANPEQVGRRLRQRLDECLPARLAARLAPAMAEQLPPGKKLAALKNGFAREALLDRLFALYGADNHAAPPRAEQQALAEYLRGERHTPLAFLLACWRRDQQGVAQALQAATDHEYKELVAIALEHRLTSPDWLVSPGRGELLVSCLARVTASANIPLAAVAEALLNAGEANALLGLDWCLAEASPGEVHRLAKVLEDHPEAPADFTQQAAAAAAAAPGGGLAGLFRGLFGGR